MASCAQCGKQAVESKRCSRCKYASYCGVACQKADWKRHKKDCAPPMPVADIVVKMHAAHAVGDWRGVLKWEGCMEQLMAMANLEDDFCLGVLSILAGAHLTGVLSTASSHHKLSFVALAERIIPLEGKLQHFLSQGKTMCDISEVLGLLDRKSEAATWSQRARDVGAANGFSTIESRSCISLGTASINEGRREEGMALLRNALVAAELNELNPRFEMVALKCLISALFLTYSIDEVEPLILRFREMVKAQSEKEGVCFAEFKSLLFSARLNEVLCLCTLRCTVSSLLAARPKNYCIMVIRAREKRHAPVEPCALCRHAGSLKRPRERCALCST